MPLPYFPIRPAATIKCDRCGLRYKKDETECPHCKDIPDGRPLDKFIAEHQDTLQANSRLGMVFVGVFVLLAVLLLAFVLR